MFVNKAGVLSDYVSITSKDMKESPIVPMRGYNALGNEYQEGAWSLKFYAGKC